MSSLKLSNVGKQCSVLRLAKMTWLRLTGKFVEHTEDIQAVAVEQYLPPLLPLETSTFCDRHFGNAWLQEWNSSVHEICPNTHNDTTMQCR